MQPAASSRQSQVLHPQQRPCWEDPIVTEVHAPARSWPGNTTSLKVFLAQLRMRQAAVGSRLDASRLVRRCLLLQTLRIEVIDRSLRGDPRGADAGGTVAWGYGASNRAMDLGRTLLFIPTGPKSTR